MEKGILQCKVNGNQVVWEVGHHETLLHALRDHGITSVKRGCEEGECGACTVLIDREAQKSCLFLALEANGKEVLTSEGLIESTGKLHYIQQAFVDEGAIQCGFCTPGFIMATYALLQKNEEPSDEEIREALSGNLCRCTGYGSIFRAVRKAARVARDAEHGSTGHATGQAHFCSGQG